jgi:hypothetical protein
VSERTNCVFFAVGRLHRLGGYLVIRRSHHSKWMPHVAWAPSIEGLDVEEFKPIAPFRGNWLQRIFPIHMLFFRGYVRVGSGEAANTRTFVIRSGTDRRKGWNPKSGGS